MDELRGWGVVSLIFVSFVGGLLMLVMRQEDIGPSTIDERPDERSNDAYQKLLELKDLYDRGIIDEATYESRKRILLQYL